MAHHSLTVTQQCMQPQASAALAKLLQHSLSASAAFMGCGIAMIDKVVLYSNCRSQCTAVLCFLFVALFSCFCLSALLCAACFHVKCRQLQQHFAMGVTTMCWSFATLLLKRTCARVSSGACRFDSIARRSKSTARTNGFGTAAHT